MLAYKIVIIKYCIFLLQQFGNSDKNKYDKTFNVLLYEMHFKFETNPNFYVHIWQQLEFVLKM